MVEVTEHCDMSHDFTDLGILHIRVSHGTLERFNSPGVFGTLFHQTLPS